MFPGHGDVSERLGGREATDGEQGPLEEVRTHRGPAGGVVHPGHEVQGHLQDGSQAGELEHGVGHHVTNHQVVLRIVLVPS